MSANEIKRTKQKYLQTLGDLNKAEQKKSGTITHAWANQERFPCDRIDPQDHDSRRNKNFTYNQNYPSRSVKS